MFKCWLIYLTNNLHGLAYAGFTAHISPKQALFHGNQALDRQASHRFDFKLL